MMRALDFLRDVRLAGYKPESVWLLIDAEQPKFWRWDDPLIEIAIPATFESLRLDFRPLVGCDVFVIAAEPSDILRRLTRKLEGLADRITVCIAAALPDTLGHTWAKGDGWREWGAL